MSKRDEALSTVQFFKTMVCSDQNNTESGINPIHTGTGGEVFPSSSRGVNGLELQNETSHYLETW